MAFDATKPAYQGPLNSQPIRDNFNSLKTQIDVGHNADGTHKDVLPATGGTLTGDLVLKDTAPSIRLIGEEGSASDLKIMESAGDLYVQKNTGTEGTPVWTTILKLNAATLMLEVARINESNLSEGTSIPDSKLDTIATAGKVATSALPAGVVLEGTAADLAQPLTMSGSPVQNKMSNASDATYYGTVYKSSTSGEVALQIRQKSDSAVVKEVTLGLDGSITAETVKAAGQLVSTVAIGTPPLAVVSATTVPNLKSQYCALADVATSAVTADALEVYTPGDFEVSHAVRSELYTGSAAHTHRSTMTKVTEMILPRGGSVNVIFDLGCSGGNSTLAHTVYGQIYVNGVSVGTVNSLQNNTTPMTQTDPVTCTETISGLNAGDYLQVYGCVASSNVANYASVFNFTIKVDNPHKLYLTYVNTTTENSYDH